MFFPLFVLGVFGVQIERVAVWTVSSAFSASGGSDAVPGECGALERAFAGAMGGWMVGRS